MSWLRVLAGMRRGVSREDANPSAPLMPEAPDGAMTQALPILEEVEATALKAYADGGLPTLPGHYQKAPGQGDWVHLGKTLDASQRWTLVLEQPSGTGWTFAALEDLGRHELNAPQLQAASALLSTCRRLRERAMGRTTGGSIEDVDLAIRLGAEWQSLRHLLAWKDPSRLRLVRPGAAAGKPEKPRRARAGTGATTTTTTPGKRNGRSNKTGSRSEQDRLGG